VLYAPQWIRKETPAPAAATRPARAYRLVSKDSAKARWLKDVPRTSRRPDSAACSSLADATWATDPEPQSTIADAARDQRRVRRQHEILERGKASTTRQDHVPTLLLHAEWDADLPSYLAQAISRS